jgi:hypothetical protein
LSSFLTAAQSLDNLRRSPRNLCKCFIEPSEVTGVEIATNLHDFKSEIKHDFVTKGCFFGEECSPAVVDNFYALRDWPRFYRFKFFSKNLSKPTMSALAIPLLRNNSTLKIREAPSGTDL